MATKKPTLQEASEAFNEILLHGTSTSGLTYEEAFEVLSQADPAKMELLNAEYWKPDTVGTYHFVFEGITKTTIKGEEVEVVNLRRKDGSSCIAGGSVLVNSCRKLTTIPAFILVDYKGLKGKKPNEYFDFEVRTFPVQR